MKNYRPSVCTLDGWQRLVLTSARTTITFALAFYVSLAIGCSSSQATQSTEAEASPATETATKPAEIEPKPKECTRTLAPLDLSAYWGSISAQDQQRKLRLEYKKAGGRIRESISARGPQRQAQALRKEGHVRYGAEMGILARFENGFVVPFIECDGRKCPVGLEVAGTSIRIRGILDLVDFNMTALADIDGDGAEEIVLSLRGRWNLREPEFTEYVVIASVEPAVLLLHRGGKECEELEIRTGSDSCLKGVVVEIGCDGNWTPYHRGEDSTFEPIAPSSDDDRARGNSEL